MSKRLSSFLLLLASAFAAARERPAKWIEVSTPRFTIVTNSSPKQGRAIAGRFERMRAIFLQAYPEIDDEPDSPVFVLAVKNKDQFRALEPSTYLSKNALRLHGLFVRASEKNYILMRLDGEAGNPYPLVYHEYSHLFLGQADQRLPLWLNEGLAEFYEQSEIYGQEVVLGEADQKHLMLLRQEKLLPLSTLFTVDEKSPYYLEQKKGAVFYAECWALTHYVMLKDYAEKTSTLRQYTKLVNENVDPITAATRVFGDLQKLQRSLEVYIEQSSFNHFETKLSSKVDESHFQVKSITPVQAQAVEAEYLVASGRPEQAKALFPSLAMDDGSTLGATSLEKPTIGPEDAIQEDSSCPLSEVLQGASLRAIEMVDNLQRFTATEQIEHTEFRSNGKPRKTANQLFSYDAEIDQGPSGAFWIEESRAAKTQGDPPPLSDTGTAAFALIFHPQKIGNFEFHCEGRKDMQGTSAWQIRFEESSDPRKSFHQIRINRSTYQLRFKGRAWIAADSYQILRLQTDLVAPLPQIQLQVEHLDIAYAPVDFKKPSFRVWLPKSASMQISYHHRRYQRVHNFSHFQLFLVLTEQSVKEPNPGPGM